MHCISRKTNTNGQVIRKYVILHVLEILHTSFALFADYHSIQSVSK